MARKKTILVTGISGFVGKWIAIALLREGFAVKGTLRDMAKADAVRQAIAAHTNKTKAASVTFAEADLLKDTGWTEAMSGADAVMHVATEVQGLEPKDPNVVIGPAIEGTRRVMQAAKEAGITRVIMTSSIATVGYGHGHTKGRRTYTEEDWTNLDGMRWKWAYCIGKTKAEREAWDFSRANGIDLTTIHPGAILGPATDADYSVSLGLVGGILSGETKAIPDLVMSISDVRDVADMHVAALKNPESAGERYLATAELLPFRNIPEILRTKYPDAPMTTKIVPNWVLKILVYFNRSVSQAINDVGNEKYFDGSKGRALLGRDYYDTRTTLIDTVESLIKVGAVKA